MLPDGFGFLRAPTTTTCPGPTTSTSRPRRSAASTCAPATRVSGPIRPPQGERARTSRCSRSTRSTGEPPEVARDKILFDNLTPLYPTQKLNLEHDAEELLDAHHRHALPDRQGPALPDRLAAARRQDGAPAEHRQRDQRQPPRDRRSSCCSSTSGPKKSPTCSARSRARSSARPSTSRPRATCRSPRW